MRARFVFSVAAMLTVPAMAQAAEIKLLASAALKAAYLELLPQFEAATGHKVAAAWSSSLVIQNVLRPGRMLTLS